MIASVTHSNKKSCFGEIVLGSDLLHQRIVQPVIQRHHGSRIASKQLSAERVDLKDAEFH